MLSIKALLIVTLFATSPLSAATLYVDIDNRKADDHSAGAQDAPFKTIQAAVNAAAPGDTIIVMPGIYRETVVITTSGISKEQPLRVISHLPGQAVINGADIVTDWKLAGVDLYKTYWPHKVNPRHTSLHGFGFKTYPDQVIIDGQPITHVEKREQLTDLSFYVDRPNKTIYLKSKTPLNDKTVEISRRTHWMIAGTRKATVRFVHIQGFKMIYSTASIQVQSMVVSGNDVVVEDNEFAYTASGCGIAFHGDNLVIKDNYIHDNGYMGFTGAGKHLSFTGNTVYRNNTKLIPGWECGAGKIVNCRNGVFSDNVFSDTLAGPGLWLDIDNYHNIIENNVFIDNADNAIMIEISYDNIVRNNIIVNTSRQKTKDCYRAGIVVQLSCKTQIYNNLIYGTDGYGVHLRWHVRTRQGHKFSPANPDEFKKAHGFSQSDWMEPNGDYPLKDNEIYNNIFIDNTMAAIRLDTHKTLVSDNRSDYNIFWNSVTHHPMDGGHRLMEWQAMTGLDEHSIYSKYGMRGMKFFVSEANMDFRPATNSPAIKAGKIIEGLTTDFNGTKRPVDTAPTIGPYQYSAPVEKKTKEVDK